MQVKSIAEFILQYKQPFVIKIYVLSIFEWPLKTYFTVQCNKFIASFHFIYETFTKHIHENVQQYI